MVHSIGAVPEFAWILGLGIAFLAGALLGYALKVRAHEAEIDGIMRIVKRVADSRPVEKKTPQGIAPPGRAGRPADPPRFNRPVVPGSGY